MQCKEKTELGVYIKAQPVGRWEPREICIIIFVRQTQPSPNTRVLVHIKRLTTPITVRGWKLMFLTETFSKKSCCSKLLLMPVPDLNFSYAQRHKGECCTSITVSSVRIWKVTCCLCLCWLVVFVTFNSFCAWIWLLGNVGVHCTYFWGKWK